MSKLFSVLVLCQAYVNFNVDPPDHICDIFVISCHICDMFVSVVMHWKNANLYIVKLQCSVGLMVSDFRHSGVVVLV